MANWCQNNVWITAPNEEDAKSFFKAISSGDGFGESEENPIAGEEPGTVLETGGGQIAYWAGADRAVPGSMELVDQDIRMTWSTRNIPPIQWYQSLESKGFIVRAQYDEQGEELFGSYSRGVWHRFDDLPAPDWYQQA